MQWNINDAQRARILIAALDPVGGEFRAVKALRIFARDPNETTKASAVEVLDTLPDDRRRELRSLLAP
ncbi:MAG: hypothetical protein AB7O45_08190 [Alphaproteobacteria bacterium]